MLYSVSPPAVVKSGGMKIKKVDSASNTPILASQPSRETNMYVTEMWTINARRLKVAFATEFKDLSQVSPKISVTNSA